MQMLIVYTHGTFNESLLVLIIHFTSVCITCFISLVKYGRLKRSGSIEDEFFTWLVLQLAKAIKAMISRKQFVLVVYKLRVEIFWVISKIYCLALSHSDCLFVSGTFNPLILLMLSITLSAFNPLRTRIEAAIIEERPMPILQ